VSGELCFAKCATAFQQDDARVSNDWSEQRFFLPLLSVLCCLALMLSLPLETWIRFVVWLGVGLVVYFAYSRKRVAG